ncbi:PRD domain-containing protein [Bacillus tianshenii]|nr:PRD domain-containing protein [Bacillus tianshenii]
MRIYKILNNNAVVVKENGEEKIVMGSGIAFQKRKNDIIPKSKIEKVFTVKEENERFQELLRTLPEEHIATAEGIITYAEQKLGVTFSPHIHIALSDHLSFALERLQKGLQIQNKLLNEIKVLYKEEYKIAQWAQEYIKEQLDVDIPDDEAGHIALHIHTAKMDDQSMNKTLTQTTMINDGIETLQACLEMPIDKESIAYQRLITHLRFALTRVEHEEEFHAMDIDMFNMIRSKYHEAFHCSAVMAKILSKEYGVYFPESEIAYLALHVQRIKNKV